jgi:DNA-binding MarR family transcriptional regulator
MKNPYLETILLGVKNRLTYREMAEEIGKTQGTVQYHMELLIEDGYVIRDRNPITKRAKARGLKLTEKGEGVFKHDSNDKRKGTANAG